MKELIDLRTLANVQDAAPIVTAVSVRGAVVVVETLESNCDVQEADVDINGQPYWVMKYEDLVKKINTAGIDEVALGRIVKALGLERIRKMDGYYVAWSLGQVVILKKHFGME